jgi:hypothetical protein
MKNKIEIKIMLGLLIAVIVFHLCILTKIIPYEITWGGRLQNDSEMYIFETISIMINLFLGFVLLMNGGYIKPYFKQSLINIILWIFLILFVLNTIGNIFAKTNFERLFAVLTLISAILIWIILKSKRNKTV